MTPYSHGRHARCFSNFGSARTTGCVEVSYSPKSPRRREEVKLGARVSRRLFRPRVVRQERPEVSTCRVDPAVDCLVSGWVWALILRRERERRRGRWRP
jgi:hypothetical protein